MSRLFELGQLDLEDLISGLDMLRGYEAAEESEEASERRERLKEKLSLALKSLDRRTIRFEGVSE